MFADKYLEKNKIKKLLNDIPDSETGIIVVIPCFDEPDVIETLESLYTCEHPASSVEIIVLVNHSESAEIELKERNYQTGDEVKNWISKHEREKFRYYVIGPVELKKKWAGAGIARKKGMDEAVLRFNNIEKAEGLIVSLDADTLVSESYLVEIENHFQKNNKQVGATIAFEHIKDNLSQKHLEGIQLYEKYLTYYKQAVEFTGYPYSMFTVGSAFVVKADAYVKRGGMNRRQAGEDFYFLQNLAHQGEVGEITTTKVFPSARLSDRVPFGTGPILKRWMNDEEDISQTYSIEAFKDLKAFFDIRQRFFGITENEYLKQIENLPDSVHYFILESKFWEELSDLNSNCSNYTTFQKRFFQKFNAFRILKFLNFAHERYYEKADLKIQFGLLKKLG